MDGLAGSVTPGGWAGWFYLVYRMVWLALPCLDDGLVSSIWLEDDLTVLPGLEDGPTGSTRSGG